MTRVEIDAQDLEEARRDPRVRALLAEASTYRDALVATRADKIMDTLARWQDAGKPGPAYRWLGWTREEWEDFEEYGVFPYPRPGAL